MENMVTGDRPYKDIDRRFTAVLNKHASKKKKWLRGNQNLWEKCKPYFQINIVKQIRTLY